MTDILEMPIDQYQRYRLAADAANALRKNAETFHALEVGGYPPRLNEFMPGDNVLVTDRQRLGAMDKRQLVRADTREDGARHGQTNLSMPHGYLCADALALPFPDLAFDIVVSLDVLEHIPASDRHEFIQGLKRVSGRYAILAAPFDDGGGMISGAERILIEFIRERHGYEHKFLAEHIENGLPDFDKTADALSEDGWETIALPCGYFTRWFGMTLLEYALEGRDKLKNTQKKLRQYYNRRLYRMDNREPSYRKLFVASRSAISEEQREKLIGLKSTEPANEWPSIEYTRTMVELARMEAQEALHAKIDGLEHELEAREEEIRHLKQHIEELSEFTDKTKKSLTYRIYSRIFK